MYKSGDVVIKRTGGNKMTISTILDDGLYKCIWFVDSGLNQGIFNKNDIILLSEYHIVESRNYNINEILK